MVRQMFLLVVVTLIPALELRASIPIGMLYGSTRFGIEGGSMSWPAVAATCMVTNILLGWAVFFALGPALRLCGQAGWFRGHVLPRLEKMRQRLKPCVDRYGELGVALFIGVPLPGSGVYTGAVGAFLLGLDRRKFVIANVLGVLIAGTIVTAACLLIDLGLDLPPGLHWILKGKG
ncbi:MAG: small multi-drug export protein [Lentisphaeria bacterium]|nr:small multi-drug export protein [Lentisphaeria bacterium]